MLQVIVTDNSSSLRSWWQVQRQQQPSLVLLSWMHTDCQVQLRVQQRSERKSKKSDTRAKKMTKEQKKQTHPWQSNRWTVQLNSKSVRDWRRSSRLPRRGRTVQLYMYSSNNSSTSSTRRCSYLDTPTGSSQSTYIYYWCTSLNWKKGENFKHVLYVNEIPV